LKKEIQNVFTNCQKDKWVLTYQDVSNVPHNPGNCNSSLSEWKTKIPRNYIERNLYSCQKTFSSLGGTLQPVEVPLIFALTRSAIWWNLKIPG